jgi:hypothetical protein
MAPLPEPHLGEILDDPQPQLGQPRRLGLETRGTGGEPHQGFATPLLERGFEARLRPRGIRGEQVPTLPGERDEPRGVELVHREVEDVPALPRGQPLTLAAEATADGPDVRLDRPDRVARWIRGPQLVDELGVRDGTAGVAGQQREHDLGLRTAQGDDGAADPDLEPSQHADVDGHGRLPLPHRSIRLVPRATQRSPVGRRSLSGR